MQDDYAQTADHLRIEDKFILGTWGLSGPVDRCGKKMVYGRDVSKSETYRIFDRAWELGIRRIDVSFIYGDGEGCARIAQWQKNTGNRFKIVLKPGRVKGDYYVYSNIDLASLINEIEIAVGFLGYPEIILVKDPPRDSFFDGRLLNLLEKLALRYDAVKIGIASHSLNNCLELANRTDTGWCAQVEYNGANCPHVFPIISKMHSKGWDITSAQPLCYGFLSGNYDLDHQFNEYDWRDLIPVEKRVELIRSARSFHRFFESRPPDVSLARICTAFCVFNPCISSVVIGTKSEEQLVDSIRSLSLLEDLKISSMIEGLYSHLQRIEHNRGGANEG